MAPALFTTAWSEAPSGTPNPDARRRFSAAAGAASKGEPDQALKLAREMLDKDPTDWRGWFLRFLGAHREPLGSADFARLDSLTADLREAYTDLWHAITADPQERVELSTGLALRRPDLAIASAVAAAALRLAGKSADALTFANRALAVDPTNEIAAREKAAILASGDHALASEWACTTLRTFPYDVPLVEGALPLCPEPETDEERLALYSGVLQELEGTRYGVRALRTLLGAAPRDRSDAVLRSVATLVHPAESDWWDLAPAWCDAIGRHETLLKEPAVRRFLQELSESLKKANTPAATLARGPACFALGRSLAAAGERERARSVLADAIIETPILRSGAVRRSLADITDKATARRLLDQADLLDVLSSRPLTARERDTARSFLPRVDFDDYPTLAGRPAEASFARGSAEVVFIWSATCTVSTSQGERLAAWTAKSLIPRSLSIRWVEHDVAGLEKTAEDRMHEWSLSANEVLSAPRGDARLLSLGVDGTPWTFLVVDGRVLAERVGEFDLDWLRLAATLAEVWRSPESERGKP